MTADSLLERLNRDGFVIIPSVLSPSQLESLRAAARNISDAARAGNWPYVRTLPKQFPPWPQSEPGRPPPEGIWGVQGLLRPEAPGRELFTSLYFSDAIINPTKELLQTTSDDDLVMELCNLLVRPDHDFELRWHRDDIPPSATDEEELARLLQPAFSAQWNLPLYEDASLIVVPGSHARARTPTERAAGPFEPHLPGQIAVRLQPGDIVFYNNNILHRGVYSSASERLTIHGSAGHAGGARLRARNVLQHGCRDWIDKCDFSVLDEKTRERAEKMRAKLIRMGQENEDVGYSLEG